jgi:hypothetical protein
MLIRLLFAVPLIVHGLAHMSGLAAAWGKTGSGFEPEPWIFSSGITLQSSVGRAWSLLWLAAGLGFVGAGLGLLFVQEWWPALVVSAAVVALVAMVPWWNSVPPGAKAGMVFDLMILLLSLSPLRNSVLRLAGVR